MKNRILVILIVLLFFSSCSNSTNECNEEVLLKLVNVKLDDLNILFDEVQLFLNSSEAIEEYSELLNKTKKIKNILNLHNENVNLKHFEYLCEIEKEIASFVQTLKEKKLQEKFYCIIEQEELRNTISLIQDFPNTKVILIHLNKFAKDAEKMILEVDNVNVDLLSQELKFLNELNLVLQPYVEEIKLYKSLKSINSKYKSVYKSVVMKEVYESITIELDRIETGFVEELKRINNKTLKST